MKKTDKELIKMYVFYKEFNELVNSSLNICLDLNTMLGGAGDALVNTFLNGLTKQLPRDIKLLRKYRKHFIVKDDGSDSAEKKKLSDSPPTTLPVVAEETRVVVCKVEDKPPRESAAE